jgi:RNA ligase
VPIRPLHELEDRHLVIEEKMDGANSAISFDTTGQLLLQSRGHFLNGGPREVQFNLFKTWTHTHISQLFDVLEDRYIMYGEWLHAKHTIFYTDLPHYFLEFDIYDKQQDEFLSTEHRQKLLTHTPCVVSVKVLYAGLLQRPEQLISLIGPSHFISGNHLERLRNACQERHLDATQVLKETDQSQLMEGLYVKIEEDGIVKERYKYVRSSFLQAVFDSESHWQDRPILHNQLKQDVSLF